MYIGESKIDKIDWNTVYFADGAVKEYTAKQLTYLVTDDFKDPTDLRNLVLENVMPELSDILAIENELEASSKIMSILEEHNITNAELQSVMSRLKSNRITKYNDMLRKKAGKIIDEYESDITKLEEIGKIVTDSYNTALFIASWKAFWTFVEGKHPEDFLDNIRFSDIRKYL